MINRLGVGLGCALLLGVAACAGSEQDDVGSAEGASSKAAAKPAAALTQNEIEDLFAAVDDNCAGNNNGVLSKFDVSKFDAKAAMAKLKEEDKDAMGSDCRSQHELSKSRESGVKLFAEHVNDKNGDTKSCLKQYLTAGQRRQLNEFVGDPKNVGVFASVYSGGDNPEGCTYYNFHIYRADGTLMELTFNYTD